jgi:hypothetical protein
MKMIPVGVTIRVQESSINKIRALGVLKGQSGSSKEVIAYIENIISQEFESILMRELLTAIGFEGKPSDFAQPSIAARQIIEETAEIDNGIDLGDDYDYETAEDESDFDPSQHVSTLDGDFDPENETLVIDPHTESEGIAREHQNPSVAIDEILTEVDPGKRQHLIKEKQTEETNDFLKRMGIDPNSVAPRVLGQKVKPNMGKGSAKEYNGNG